MYEPRATGWSGVLLNEVTSAFLMMSSPLFDLFYWVVYKDFDASLTSAVKALLSSDVVSYFSSSVLLPTRDTILAYLFWVAFQAILYVLLPGPLHHAPRTPGGRRLPYRLNGLNAWVVTVAIAAAASYYKLINPTFIAENWGELLSTASVYSTILIFVFYIKARVKPDNKGDTLITGHFWYDLFNGGELHPRTGQLFDWKHFNASRTGGILLWTLIDLSFAALQYQNHGKVTNSMILAVLFRVVIVVEYFYVEDIFFETLDGAHERFSFYSIYGFAVMMPHLWTLQTQYLALYPVELSTFTVIATSALFANGWALNHYANDQKNLARRTAGQCQIWGKDAEFIKTTYQTADGKTHHSLLLCSGWWGVVRHANYLGSFTYTLASCLICGTSHALPYTEAFLVMAMTIHRCWRDEARCKTKYGKTWDEYCQRVKWRIIPGVY